MNTKKKIKFFLNKSFFYYHLKELKLRTWYLVSSFLLTFFICYYYCFEIVYLFVKPFLNYDKNFIFTDLTEAFYSIIHLNFIVSLFILIPFIIYNIWCFFIPSTFLEERKKYNFFFSAIIFLLFISACFYFFFLLPELYKFLFNFEINTSFLIIKLEARIQSYIELCCSIFFLCSILFQIPLFFFLGFEYKLLSSDFLIKNRFKVIFINLLLAAFISPPELVTQIVIAMFLQFIFEISLLILFIYKKLK